MRAGIATYEASPQVVCRPPQSNRMPIRAPELFE